MLRFTPTHVGNTPAPPVPRLLPAVHPHACGEHDAIEIVVSPGVGSPPRMWGTRKRSVDDATSHGSPPRMWGTPAARRQSPHQRRFTPTHVGNTRARMPTLCWTAVHPHACGEHLGIEIPRRRQQRFTPTHVGNTHQRQYRASPVTVHPHACGEHAMTNNAGARAIGSPPRMWGTRGHAHIVVVDDRFTPTHVGNTRRLADRLGITTVHPHACGEHDVVAQDPFAFPGSPPRMWGTHPG